MDADKCGLDGRVQTNTLGKLTSKNGVKVMDESEYLQKAKGLALASKVQKALNTLKEGSKLIPHSWQILLTAGQILS
jgi:hypothetical protein